MGNYAGPFKLFITYTLSAKDSKILEPICPRPPPQITSSRPQNRGTEHLTGYQHPNLCFPLCCRNWGKMSTYTGFKSKYICLSSSMQGVHYSPYYGGFNFQSISYLQDVSINSVRPEVEILMFHIIKKILDVY